MRILGEAPKSAFVDPQYQIRTDQLIDLLEAEIGVLDAIAVEVDDVEISGLVDGVRVRLAALLIEVRGMVASIRALSN